MNVFELVDEHYKMQQGRTWEKPLSAGHFKTTSGKVVVWGTPEYKEAYDRGEVVTDKGVKSPTTLQGGQLDEVVVKNNHKRGFWEQYRDKIIEENKDAGVLGAAVGVPLSAVASLPQLAMMKGLTGKMQRPSEAIGFENNQGLFESPSSFGKHASNFVLDAVTDPANLIGAGVLTKEKLLANVRTSIAPELRQGLRTQGFSLNSDVGDVARSIENYDTARSRITTELLNSTFDEYFRNAPNAWKRRFEIDPESKKDFLDMLSDNYGNNPSFNNVRNEMRDALQPLESILQQKIEAGIIKPPSQISPLIRNKSGLTVDELKRKALKNDSGSIDDLTQQDFEQTILKPTEEFVPYYQGSLEPYFRGSNSITSLSKKQYIDEFNSKLDLLNEIIAKKNKSGVEYKVKGLDSSDRLTFYSPSLKGENVWGVKLNPGKWQGNVEDIASTEYLKAIPGIEMDNTISGVFADNIARRGSGAYEAINEYLKRMDLGRVKAGFNSQSSSAKNLWENAVKSEKAVGFYNSPSVIHGAMKSIVPIAGASYLATQGQQEQNPPQYQQGGEYSENEKKFLEELAQLKLI